MNEQPAIHPLRYRRLKAAMLQTRLAELTGRSQACISRVETGALTPSQDFYAAAARALSCRPEDLMPNAAEGDD